MKYCGTATSQLASGRDHNLVIDRKGKLLQIDDGDRQHIASIDRIKGYHERTPSSHVQPENHDGQNGSTHANNAPHGTYTQKRNNRIDDAVTEFEDIMSDISKRDPSRQLRDGSKTLRRLDEILGIGSIYNDIASAITIDQSVMRVLKNSDERVKSPDFVKARQKEVNGLRRRNIWETVEVDDLEDDANVLGGRFVYTLKNYGAPNETSKARYVAEGFSDEDKPHIVHDTATLRASSVIVVLSTAATHGFKIFSHDVNQPYLQSKYKLTSDVYIKPKKEDLALFDLTYGKLLKLRMPLYGVCDAEDY